MTQSLPITRTSTMRNSDRTLDSVPTKRDSDSGVVGLDGIACMANELETTGVVCAICLGKLYIRHTQRTPY